MRLIDADALIAALTPDPILECGCPEPEGLGEFSDWLDMAPTVDAVEVVHCEHCIFNHWHKTPNGEKYHICNLNKLSFSEHEDFFCKYGERRHDEQIH